MSEESFICSLWKEIELENCETRKKPTTIKNQNL